MPPKSRSQSRKNPLKTQGPDRDASTLVSKQTAESIGAIKLGTRKKRTIKQQQDEMNESLADLKIQAPPLPVNLNEQKKRVRVEEPPHSAAKPLKLAQKPKNMVENPQVPEKQKPAQRKSRSTQKVQLPQKEDVPPKPLVKSRSQARNKSTDKKLEKSGKKSTVNQKPNVQAADVHQTKKIRKQRAASETESEGPLSEFLVRAEALQSIGWQSPNSSFFKKQKLKIVYPNLVMKSTKSQRMSLLDNSNATLDEKEMRQIKNNLRAADEDFKEWDDSWKKLRVDTKKQMNEKHNKSWDNFKKMYEQKKSELFNLK